MKELNELLNDYDFAHQAGRQIAEDLNLKKNRTGNYPTMYGTKSEAGLARTVYNILNRQIKNRELLSR